MTGGLTGLFLKKETNHRGQTELAGRFRVDAL
jgi:hypothetical protein